MRQSLAPFPINKTRGMTVQRLMSIAGRPSGPTSNEGSSEMLYDWPTVLVDSIKALTASDVQMAQESHLDGVVDIRHGRSCLR